MDQKSFDEAKHEALAAVKELVAEYKALYAKATEPRNKESFFVAMRALQNAEEAIAALKPRTEPSPEL